MLPVHERFYTWQGEGVHMGKAAFFIRLFGCPMHCPWCDSAGTWHKDYVPKTIHRMEESDLVDEVLAAGAQMVVITGGEPAIHDLRPLTIKLKAAKIRVHLETSGAFPLQGFFDWITVSPKNKWAKPVLLENVALASEFKLIIEDPADIPYWVGVLEKEMVGNQNIWLHPEWSRRNDPAVLNGITEYVKRQGGQMRAGYQMHKLYRADALDNRSATLAPLGGNPKLGY